MLSINLKGKRVFIAGVGDDQGYGWAIAKVLAEAGAELIFGTWPPVYKIFKTSLERGKFDESRKLSDGSLMEIAEIYPLDAVFDTAEDVPEEIRQNKRYQLVDGYTISEVAAKVEKDFGKIDYLVHSLANGPEAKNALLETSRKGYLSAVSASSYSFISLLQHFGPLMNEGGSVLALSYIAAQKVIPGYGGGLNAAKAALESDTRLLAWEAYRSWGVRVNTISAGPLGSRAAKAIGFIDRMIDYCEANAPLAKSLQACEVGNVAAFLLSSLSSAITGSTIFVDNGMHTMGVAIDSPALAFEKTCQETVK